MRVLMCTPYPAGPNYVQGGIAIWAKSITDYAEALAGGADLHVVPFNRVSFGLERVNMIRRAWRGILEYWGPIKEAVRQIRSRRFDVLHICTSGSISLLKDIFLIRRAKRYGLKTVIHFHFGLIPVIAQKKNWEWRLLRQAVAMADEAVTMDLNSYRALKENACEHVHYLPNPVSVEVIRQVSEEAEKVEKMPSKVSYVGRLIPTKGIVELIEACKGIRGLELHLYGKMDPALCDYMKGVLPENADWLKYEGEVDHRRVVHELLSTGIFVLPSYTEGFPLTVLEGMACGCAIVATDVGAIPDMLNIDSSEPCGICSAPKDIEALRSSIRHFIDNPSEAREYGLRAQKRVNEHYSMPLVWASLLQIWRASRPA